MKKWIFTALLVAGLYTAYQQNPYSLDKLNPALPAELALDNNGATTDSSRIAAAYSHQLSDIQVGGSGRVIKILADDTKGSRHQKFILKLASGQTLLVAHNIDLAPRLADLQMGENVAFYGEYDWNKLGGVLHWTHHDPAGRHIGGWLEYRGRRYQ
ncbi:DUF3465 domain-containing protein [Zhongshania sp.]|jgi:hypothetical protein|uniref:DUF3465 domain-containing protein n=1 Tax=Zhongshania sp. TaxID=1971902 RepID=UPI0039E31AD1